MKIRPVVMSVASAIACLAVLTAAAPPPEPPRNESLGWITVGNERYTPDELASSGLSASTPAGSPNSRLIDFPQWVQCFTINDSEMVIREYVHFWNGIPQTKRLRCGTAESFGYKHIRAEKEQLWQSRLNTITPSGLFPNVSWDDLMNAAVVNALMVPDFAQDQSGGKRCLVIKMGFYNQYGVLLDAYDIRTIISLTNDRVITAFPLRDGQSYCSG